MRLSGFEHRFFDGNRFVHLLRSFANGLPRLLVELLGQRVADPDNYAGGLSQFGAVGILGESDDEFPGAGSAGSVDVVENAGSVGGDEVGDSLVFFFSAPRKS